MIEQPYLLFLGDVTDALDAKTASGIAYWRQSACLGQTHAPGGTVDLGLPTLSPAEAAEKGARTLIIGVANEGGYIPQSWVPSLEVALVAGLDIASGLHARLADIPSIKSLAEWHGRRLIDVRTPPSDIPVASGVKRPGKRLLTVGTDCAIGKMYAVLALEKAMQAAGIQATFRATGQTGIFIAGTGMPLDAVVADFIAGAAEQVSPANKPDHWDLIEGQGSLFHPSYAGVTLGLLHGSQPDALILCHKAGLSEIDGHPGYKIPPLANCIAQYEQAARITNPHAKVVALSVNTSSLREEEAHAYLSELADKFGMPAIDPVRTGLEPVVDVLRAL